MDFLISPEIFILKRFVLFLIPPPLSVHVSASIQRGHSRDIRSPGIGGTASYELPDVNAGNRTQVLCKYSALS